MHNQHLEDKNIKLSEDFEGIIARKLERKIYNNTFLLKTGTTLFCLCPNWIEFWTDDTFIGLLYTWGNSSCLATNKRHVSANKS